MEIAGRTMESDFESGNSAQSVCKGRMTKAWNAGVGNNDGIAEEFLAMGLQKRFQIGASDFFFTFNQKSDVAREFRAGFQIGFNGLKMSKVLPLIVTRATPEQ